MKLAEVEKAFLAWKSAEERREQEAQEERARRRASAVSSATREVIELLFTREGLDRDELESVLSLTDSVFNQDEEVYATSIEIKVDEHTPIYLQAWHTPSGWTLHDRWSVQGPNGGYKSAASLGEALAIAREAFNEIQKRDAALKQRQQQQEREEQHPLHAEIAQAIAKDKTFLALWQLVAAIAQERWSAREELDAILAEAEWRERQQRAELDNIRHEAEEASWQAESARWETSCG